MSSYSGPEIANDGLVFSIDVSSPKCISASAARGFNNAPQLVRNLVSPSDVITSTDTLRLGNLSYYTAFSLDYPESVYGGDAVSMQGITPGFNVRSGSKTYDASRALHLWVWDNETSTWVSDSFFTGERLSGHCYDSYVGTAEVDKWVVDFNKIKNTFRNITVIASGSHRDSYHTTAQYEILRDLGAPSNVDSIIGFSSPEWILVGKPGIGAGNGAWAFQNYSTNPDQVAHMNFGLPFKGSTNNYLNFNGNDKLDIPISGNPSLYCLEIAIRNYKAIVPNTNMAPYYSAIGFTANGYSTIGLNLGDWTSSATDETLSFWHYGPSSSGANYIQDSVDANWNIYTINWNGSGYDIWLNGVKRTGYQFGTMSLITNLTNMSVGYNIGWNYWFKGDISNIKIYNRQLTDNEVQQNFQALRSRFGI